MAKKDSLDEITSCGRFEIVKLNPDTVLNLSFTYKNNTEWDILFNKIQSFRLRENIQNYSM